MEPPMLSRKRPRLSGHEKEPPLYSKKCLSGLKALLDRYQTDSWDRDAQGARLETSRRHLRAHAARVNAQAERRLGDERFSERMSAWADTQYSVWKVLERLKSGRAAGDIRLSDGVNKRFLEFHKDITEECGAEDKQHSWAVLEKQEEVVMYGPYYPNYGSGEHSEDVVVKQTQELLEAEEFSEGRKVYVFTVNSPCLARNTDPCMLTLVRKAQEWWSEHGAKTHIGYVRCWGFKGTKENLFRDIDYSQVDCINQAEGHEDYVKAAETRTDLKPLCGNLSSAVKRLLKSGNLSFPLMTAAQRQDWKTYFKKLPSPFENAPEEEEEEEGKVFTQELNAAIEAALAQVFGKRASFEEHLERGKAFDHTFGPQVPDALRDQTRVAFQRCWREMVQDRYAEWIRERLTDDFNRHTAQLFIGDIVEFTNEYLQIGRIRFSEEESNRTRAD